MKNTFNPTHLALDIEKKTSNLPAKAFVCAGISSIIIGKAFKSTGHAKTGAFIASLAIPLLAFGAYKKFSSKSSEDSNTTTSTGNLQTT